MKTISAIALLLTIWFFGCQHPTEVQVQQDAQPDPVVVTPVPVDTTTYQSLLDSAAITPADQARFFGFLLATRTQYDNGGPLVTKTISNVMFTDPQRPLTIGGKTFGYWGFNIRPRVIAPLTINGHPMILIPHRIAVASVPIPYGSEFYWDALGNARFDTTFTWKGQTDSIGLINVTVDAPSSLNVTAPKGGGIYSRTENLILRWSGSGEITIYLSSVNQLTNVTRPLMMFRPLGTSGRAVINSNVLGILPANRHYVLTFVRATRDENPPSLLNFSGKVLAQVASVYNCYVEIR